MMGGHSTMMAGGSRMGGFPNLGYESNALNPVEFQKKNIVLDLDNQLYSTR